MNATRMQTIPDPRRSIRVARTAIKVASLPLGILGGRQARDVVILGYHRVGGGMTEIDLSSSMFSNQLDYLAESDVVRSLDDALQDGGAVVLTFDDGTRDFYEGVLPLLVERRLPALVYLATGITEEPEALGLGPGLTWPMLQEAVSTGLVTVGIAYPSACEPRSRVSRRGRERDAPLEGAHRGQIGYCMPPLRLPMGYWIRGCR